MILSRLLAAFLLCAAAFAQSPISPTLTTTTMPPPPQDPKILEDGGISIEPFYWITRAQPALFGGKTATAYGNLSYIGRSKSGLGGEIGIPAGRANTLRFSYFRVQGNSNPTLGQGATIFSEAYTAGDYIAANYRLQSAKVSWDYLSYTFRNHVRFKTLYEVQYVTISTNLSAPLAAQTTDSSGNLDTNSSSGSRSLVYPTFGAEFEQRLGKHLRWELKGSGFGLPHHAVIWDAQADLALRFHSLELVAGGKAYHFKTSPNSDQYFTDTLEGTFFGLRYYWGQTQN